MESLCRRSKDIRHVVNWCLLHRTLGKIVILVVFCVFALYQKDATHPGNDSRVIIETTDTDVIHEGIKIDLRRKLTSRRTVSRGDYKSIATVNFRGDIGDQMFMYAALMGIADELGFDARVPRDLPLRSIFNLSMPVLPEDWFEENRPIIIDEEKNHCFRDENLLFKLSQLNTEQRGVVISGYLKTWRYFDNITNVIRNEFTFRNEIRTTADVIMHQIRQNHGASRHLVGLYIQSGDASRRNHKYEIRKRTFFEKAIKLFTSHINSQYGKRAVFVVADDNVDWSRRFLTGLHPFLEFIDGGRAAVNLAVISQCDHVVFDTGSIGWWCGWLSGGKTIYQGQYNYKHCQIPKGSELGDEYVLPHWLGL